ncbi:hypothetical protein D3C84_653030 [compost metagenome]
MQISRVGNFGTAKSTIVSKVKNQFVPLLFERGFGFNIAQQAAENILLNVLTEEVKIDFFLAVSLNLLLRRKVLVGEGCRSIEHPNLPGVRIE